MPHYYFNIRDDVGGVPDEEGADFADLDAARAEAHKSARDLLAAAIKSGKPLMGRRVEIVDDQGMILETVSLSRMLT